MARYGVARSSVIGWVSRRRVAVMVAALVVAVAVWDGVEVHAGVTRRATPFPFERMQPRVTLTVTAFPRTQALIDRLAGRGRLPGFAFGHRQQLVGQLVFHTVDRSWDGGQLALFVIDNRINQPLRYVSGVAAKGNGVSEGWDGDYERLATKYAWLRPLAAVRRDGGFADPGDSISFRPGTRGPVTFTAVMDAYMVPLQRPAGELSFVLAYVGRAGVWAHRVPVSSARTDA